MFYSTTIKSIGYGGVLDIYGNWLTFIGYLPVQVGDTVFTDGNVIFGNVPPKSSVTNIALEASGVPVLAANLRGYFNRHGVFKSYSIAGELWIVNSNEFFTHDLSYDDNEIIDAFISQSGQCLLASGGIYKKSTQLDIHYPLFISYHSYDTSVKDFGSDYYFESREYEPCPLILGSTKFGNFNIPMRTFNDGLLTQSFDLKTYGDMIESYALQCADDILAQSYKNSSSDGSTSFEFIFERQMNFDVSWKESLADFFSDSELLKGNVKDARHHYMPEDSYTRPNTFIAHTCAHVLTCNITESGFSAIVFAVSYGYCFPYLKPRFMKSYPPPQYDDASMWNRTLTRVDGSNFAYVQEWKCVPFGSSAIFHVSNGELQKIVSFRNFGGLDSALIVPRETCKIAPDSNAEYFDASYDSLAFDEATTTDDLQFLTRNNESHSDVSLLPVGDGFFSLNKFGSLSFFDSNLNLVATDILIPDFLHIEAQSAFFEDKLEKAESRRYSQCYVYNTELIWEADWSDNVFLPFNDKPDYIRCKHFSYSGSSEHTCSLFTSIDTKNVTFDFYDMPTDRFLKKNVARDDGYNLTLDSAWHSTSSYYNWFTPFDGFYRRDGNAIENLYFTPLFYDFKNGSFLYGVKGGDLYFQSRSNTGDISVTQVASNCKNFRLCELKHIENAKS